MSLSYDDSLSLALLFHLNSEPWLNKEAYEQVPKAFLRPSNPENKRIALPPAEPSALADLIRQRQSCRNFLPTPLPIAKLAVLLQAGYGVEGMRYWPDQRAMLQRSVPSAGGLYPLSLYLIAERVAELPTGLYRYDPEQTELETIMPGLSIQPLIDEFMGQRYIANAGCLVLITAHLPRTLDKYGARGYRYVLFEAGHAAQNLCLSAAEQHLASLCIGGFQDSHINRLLKLNGRTDVCLYCVAIGYAADSGNPNSPES